MLPRTIVGIGASSLAGIGDAAGGGFLGRLRQWHELKSLKNSVFNLGIGGQTTAELIERFQAEVSLRRPELIIIATGLNDTRRIGSSNAPVITDKVQFRKNIHTLIDQGKTLGKVVFVSANPIDDSRTQPLIYWSQDLYYALADAIEYAAIVKSVCAERNIPHLDIFNDWLKADYIQWLAEDGLHANAEGHTKIYEELKLFLEGLYPE